MDSCPTMDLRRSKRFDGLYYKASTSYLQNFLVFLPPYLMVWFVLHMSADQGWMDQDDTKKPVCFVSIPPSAVSLSSFFVQTTYGKGIGEKKELENFKNDFLYGGIIVLYKRSFFRTYIY